MNGAKSENQFSPEERLSGLFASLVLQQSNMAFMLLGRGPSAEGGRPVKDLEAARLFIDHLEMLEARTHGNLSKEESALLKQSLMNLRLAFVQAVDEPPAEKAAASQPQHKESGAAEAAASPPGKEDPSAEPPPEESHKKFSKKY